MLGGGKKLAVGVPCYHDYWLLYGTWVMPKVKDIRKPANKIRFAGPKKALTESAIDDLGAGPSPRRGVDSSTAMPHTQAV